MEPNTASTTAETIDNIPRLHFWQDGLAAMTGHAVALLERAKQPVTNENIVRVVEGAPRSREQLADELWRRDSFCCRCLEIAHLGEGRHCPHHRATFEYFLVDFPMRHPVAQDLLVDSFRAILGTLGRETFGKHHDARELADLIKEVMAQEFAEREIPPPPLPRRGLLTWLKRRMRRGR